jgi:hypothetical protein
VPFVRIRPTRWFVNVASVPDAVSLLAERARILECAHDERAAFCRAYATRLAANTKPPISNLAARIEIELASRYLCALHAWDGGDMSRLATVWRAVLAHQHRGGINPDDSIELGWIAMGMYELPLAIARHGLARMPTELMTAVPGVGAAALEIAAELLEATDDAVRARTFARIENDALKRIALCARRIA